MEINRLLSRGRAGAAIGERTTGNREVEAFMRDEGYYGATEGELAILPSGPVSTVQRIYRPKRYKKRVIGIPRQCHVCQKDYHRRYSQTVKDFSKSRYCSLKCLRSDQEVPGCITAIVQALRFVFHIRPCEIAKLMKVSRSNVTNFTTGYEFNMRPWWKRKYQQEAIKAAGKLLQSQK